MAWYLVITESTISAELERITTFFCAWKPVITREMTLYTLKFSAIKSKAFLESDLKIIHLQSYF